MMMTPAQNIAILCPCYLACETAHPRYAHRLPGGASLVLTVNSGYE